LKKTTKFNKSTYASITLVALLTGMLMVFQFRATSSIARGIPTDRVQELTIEKKQVERDLANLVEEADDLAAKLEEAGKGRTEAAVVLESELTKVKLYAGLTQMVGPGVEVVLDNPPGTTGHGSSPGLFNVRDEDLLKVINDLRGAGAEVIAVNDQRILATSEVRLAGNHININLARLSPPYKIHAIGNAGVLKSSLEIRGGLVEYLSANGIIINVQTSDSIIVPAYTGGLRFDYSKHALR